MVSCAFSHFVKICYVLLFIDTYVVWLLLTALYGSEFIKVDVLSVYRESRSSNGSDGFDVRGVCG